MLPPPELLERAAAASWPAAVAEEAGGWLLRATPGTSGRRLNSALPLVASPDVSVVRAWYGGLGLPPLVQVAPAHDFTAVDQELAALGWAAEAPTAVLAAPCGTITETASERVSVVAIDRWVEAWRGVGAARAQEPAAADVLTRISAPALPLVASLDGSVAGVALAVLQPAASIVFSVAVAPEHRRQGVALDLMAAWAARAGDRALFLQTFEDNDAAIALYTRLGFTRSHGYHYRRAP